MVSVSYAIVIFSIAFYLVWYGKEKENKTQLPLWALIGYYAVSRGILVGMNQDKADAWMIKVVIDLLAVMVFFLIEKYWKIDPDREWTSAFLFCPAVLFVLDFGSVGRQLVYVFVYGVILFVCSYVALRTDKRVKNLVLPNALMGYGVFFYLIGEDYGYESLTDYAMWKSMGMVLFLLGIVCCAVLLWKDRKDADTKAEEEVAESDRNLMEREKFGRKQLLTIMVLTIGYAILLFLRLGAKDAPQSAVELEAGEEMLIDLGEEYEMNEFYIHLGNKEEREIEIFTWDKSLEEWVSRGTKTITSVFCWNEIEDITTEPYRYLTIRILSEESVINEIVFLDQEGEVVTPVNADEFEGMFDEQEKWKGTPTYYYRTIFDEIYHARTGYEIAHRLPIYETTHPQLGKIFMSFAIRTFGMTPFGFRFASVVFGILMVPLMYLFTFRMWGNSRLSLAMTLLLCSETMYFTLSRIATIDIMIAVFVMATFYLMYEFLMQWKKTRQNDLNSVSVSCFQKEYIALLCCGVALGLSIATKWTGFYGAMGIAIIFFYFLLHYYLERNNWSKTTKRHLGIMFLVCVAAFVIIPLIIYTLSFIPYVLVDDSKTLIATMIDNSYSMFSYHENQVFDHPYATEWYEWLIDKQPLLDAVNYIDGEKSVSVATFGNPILVWCGLAAFFYNMYLWKVRKNERAAFLCIAYLSMLVPWWFVHRTVFIYQYFISLLLLIPMIGNACYEQLEQKGRKKETICYRKLFAFTAVSVAAFVILYPAASGYPMKFDWFYKIAEILPTWIFA